MSDIQRYWINIPYDNHGNTDQAEVCNDGDWVRYDDHTKEVERLTKRLESALKHSIAIQDDHTALQARIEELEEEFRCLEANYVSPKILKAEGIIEMLLYCMVTKPEVDEYGVPVRIIDIDDIEQYANKLRGEG